MFNSLLVPLDGSQFAEAALPLVVRLARSAGARLDLVLIHEPRLALVGMGDGVLPPPDLEGELQATERSYLAEKAAELHEATGRAVGYHEVDGVAGPEICAQASRLGTDLIVMATHSRGALGRFWLGGVADYVLRHAAVPVLLLPPVGPGAPERTTRLRNILVALDLSRDAEAILGPVTRLAQLIQAHVTLIHVVQAVFEFGRVAAPHSVALDPAIVEAARTEAQRKLDRIADRLRSHGLSVSARVTVGLSAPGSLLEALEEERFDLIALSTYGSGGMRRLLVGSTTAKVIRRAGKPVLAFRPRQLK